MVPAFAGLGTTVSSIEANITPGERFSENITIYTEKDNVPMDLVANVCGMIQTPDGTTNAVAANKDTYQYSAVPFLNISPAQFHLEPGDKKQLTFEGTIPQNVGEGGRYAIIQVESAPTGKGTVGIALALEIPVKLSINNTNHIKTGNITSLEIAKPISGKKQDLTLKFQNTGNYHYKATAEAVIKDDSSSILANASTPLGYSNIIPLAVRSATLTLTPEKELKPGTYHIEASVVRDDGVIVASKNEDLKL